MLPVDVRVALPEEYSLLTALDRQVNPSPWSEERFRSVCAPASTDTVLVAQHAAEVRGYLVYSCVLDEATLLSIGVHDSTRGLGLGGRLLDAACRRMHAEGASRCLLEVRESNRVAIALYESRGFQRDGIRKRYYRNETGFEDALLMSRLLPL